MTHNLTGLTDLTAAEELLILFPGQEDQETPKIRKEGKQTRSEIASYLYGKINKKYQGIHIINKQDNFYIVNLTTVPDTKWVHGKGSIFSRAFWKEGKNVPITRTVKQALADVRYYDGNKIYVRVNDSDLIGACNYITKMARGNIETILCF